MTLKYWLSMWEKNKQLYSTTPTQIPNECRTSVEKGKLTIFLFFFSKIQKKCPLTLGVEKNFLRFKGGKLCKSSFGKLDCFTFENLFLQKKVKREAPNC